MCHYKTVSHYFHYFKMYWFFLKFVSSRQHCTIMCKFDIFMQKKINIFVYIYINKYMSCEGFKNTSLLTNRCDLDFFKVIIWTKILWKMHVSLEKIRGRVTEEAKWTPWVMWMLYLVSIWVTFPLDCNDQLNGCLIIFKKKS